MIESHLFRRLRFIYQGIDYQSQIRQQVRHLKSRFEHVLHGNDQKIGTIGNDTAKAVIPVMDDNGKLIFDNAGDELVEEESNSGKKRPP